MRPLKSLEGFAPWLLRITALIIIYVLYFDLFVTFAFSGLTYFISALYVVFGVLLLVGGFSKNQSLTVISGLIIFLLSVWMIFRGYTGLNISLGIKAALTSVGLYFATKGN